MLGLPARLDLIRTECSSVAQRVPAAVVAMAVLVMADLVVMTDPVVTSCDSDHPVGSGLQQGHPADETLSDSHR